MKLTKEQLVDAIMQTKQYHNQHSGGGGGDVTALTSLSDVSLDSPEDGQTLIFSAADNMWHNAAVPSSGGGGGAGSHNNVYSTQEQIVGTWIDGKPIYRKVLDYSNELWASGTKDITELFIEQIISSYFIGCDDDTTGGGTQWAQGVISSNNKYLYFSEGYTQMFRTGNAYYKYVILEYTKIKTYPEESFVDKYTVVTTSTSGTKAAVRVTNILDGTYTDIVYTSVINGNYVDFGEFTIRYTDQYTGWLLTCTSEVLKVGTSVLINGKSKSWLYNTSIDFVVSVYTE